MEMGAGGDFYSGSPAKGDTQTHTEPHHWEEKTSQLSSRFFPPKNLSGLLEAAGLGGSFCCLSFSGGRERERKGRKKEE